MSCVAVANRQAVCRICSKWTWFALEILMLAVPGTFILQTRTSHAQWSVTTKPEVVAAFLTLKSDEGDPPSYALTLHRTIDLEELRDKHGSHGFSFSLYFVCNPPEDDETKIETILEVMPVNEFRPKFNTTNIEVYVEEGVLDIVNLKEWASDEDFEGVIRNIQAFEFVAPKNPLLKINIINGKVTAKSPLDYDSLPKMRKYIEAKVRVVDAGNKEGMAYLTIHLINVDDLAPKFTYPGCLDNNCHLVTYEANVPLKFTGTLSGIRPAPIMAEDRDKLAPRITYRISLGPRGYRRCIRMDLESAIVTITKPLDRLIKKGRISVIFMIKATEDTPNHHYESTLLQITVGKGVIPRTRTPSSVPLYIVAITILGVVMVLICATAACVGVVVQTGRRRRESPVWKSESYLSTEESRSASGPQNQSFLVVSPEDIQERPRSSSNIAKGATSTTL